MIAGGGRRIVEVVVVGGGEALCTPCGGCRQRLNEFAAPDTRVHVCGPEGLRRTFTLGELLPAPSVPAIWTKQSFLDCRAHGGSNGERHFPSSSPPRKRGPAMMAEAARPPPWFARAGPNRRRSG